MRNKHKGLIFVISGPSGSGKTTLLKSLFRYKDLKKKIVRSASFTTRPRRPGEKKGEDYFFITGERFRQYLKAKKILESTRYLGYYYATPRDFVDRHLRRGKYILLCLDLRGAARIKRLYPESAVTVFVRPPSFVALSKRIRNRCRKTDAGEIRRRLALARGELLYIKKYDYAILNKDLNKASRKLKEIILKEARLRMRGN